MQSTNQRHFKQQSWGVSTLNTSRLSSPDLFLKKVIRLIQINFDNELFDVSALARQMHLSVSQLNRKLNAKIQQSAGHLIWRMKMNYAAELLTQHAASISDVAYQVGYNNQAHFCRSFKRRFACTPSIFRKRIATNAVKR